MSKPVITQLDDGIMLVNKISECFPDGFECEYYEEKSRSPGMRYYASEIRPLSHTFDIVHGSYKYCITVDEPHTGNAKAWIESANFVEDPEREHNHASITTDKLIDCLENSIMCIKCNTRDDDMVETIEIDECISDVINGRNKGTFTIVAGEEDEDDVDDGFVYECAYAGCDESVTLGHRYDTIRHECESCDRTTQFERTED